MNVYDREGYIPCCPCGTFTEGKVSDKYIVVGKPAIDLTEVAKLDAERGSTRIGSEPFEVQDAANVPPTVAHCVTPEMWKELFEDLQQEYDGWDTWNKYIYHAGLPLLPACLCQNSFYGCCFCYNTLVERLTSNVVEKHRSRFASHGAELSHIGTLDSRYWSDPYSADSSTSIKKKHSPTIKVKIKAKEVNPEVAARVTELERQYESQANAVGLFGSMFGSTQVAPPGSVGPSVTERLTELNQLKEAGLLNDEEYAAKKKAIVESL